MTDHVTNKNLSIKLKEAGFEQVSEFYWCEIAERQNGPVTNITLYGTEIAKARMYNSSHLKTYSAYLATELLKWLPTNLTVNKMKYDLSINPIETQINGTTYYIVDYSFYSLDVLERIFEKQFIENTLQDALGEMLLYLKKEGLI